MELNEMCFLTSVVIHHKRLTLGGSTEHFTTNDGFKVMAYVSYSVEMTMQFGNFGIKMVPNVVLTSLIAGYLYLSFLSLNFTCLLHSQSFQSLFQPCCKCCSLSVSVV